ncbi:hypothetical protein [Brevundimonas sp. AJA228-03]
MQAAGSAVTHGAGTAGN